MIFLTALGVVCCGYNALNGSTRGEVVGWACATLFALADLLWYLK